MANPHPEPHPENLRPFKKGDPDAKETQRKGARKSTEAQIRKRTMREWAQMYGELPLHPDKIKDPKSAEGIRDANPTMDGAVIGAMYGKAVKGDVRAANFLAQMKGQIGEEITVHADPMTTLTEDQVDAIIRAIAEARKSDE